MKLNHIFFVMFILLLSVPAFAQACYIEAILEDSLIAVRVDTLRGLFAIGLTDGTELTYPPMETAICSEFASLYGSGNGFSVNLGGNVYRSYNASYAPEAGIYNLDDYYTSTSYDSIENEIISTWSIPLSDGDIDISQIVRPTFVERFPQIEIKYEIINNSDFAMSAGLKMIFNASLAWASVDFPEAIGVFYDSGTPENWNIYEDLGSGRCSRGFLHKAEPYPDVFGFGEAGMPSGIADFAWDISPAPWIRIPYVEPCAMLRWNSNFLDVDERFVFTTYYGIGDTISVHPDVILYPHYPENPTFESCAIDSIVRLNFQIVQSAMFLDSTLDITVCLDLTHSLGLLHVGRTCDTFPEMPYLDIEASEFLMKIPTDYSLTDTIIDPLIFKIIYGDSMEDTLTVIDTFICPYFNASPPVITFIESTDDSTDLRFYTEDEDASIQSNYTRMSIETSEVIRYFLPYQGIFWTIDDTIYCPLSSMMHTTDGISFVLFDTVEVCVTHVEDAFGCVSEEMCVTVVLPYVTLDPNFPENPTFGSCTMDSIVNGITQSTTFLESTLDMIVCLDLTHSLGLLHLGRTCDTLTDMEYLDIRTSELLFKIPTDYSLSGTIIDPLIFKIFYGLSMWDTVTVIDTFICPYFDATPPVITFIESTDDSTDLRFYTDDEDTTAVDSRTRITIESSDEIHYIQPNDSIFWTSNDTIYCPLTSIITSSDGDTFALYDTVEVCVIHVEDAFGCVADEICVTVVFPPNSIEENLPRKLSCVAYPNPFNSICKIEYSFESQTNAMISIHDIQGKEIEEFNLQDNRGLVQWDASGCESGVYLVKIVSGEQVIEKKVVFIR